MIRIPRRFFVKAFRHTRQNKVMDRRQTPPFRGCGAVEFLDTTRR
jgi:hypothetical protein